MDAELQEQYLLKKIDTLTTDNDKLTAENAAKDAEIESLKKDLLRKYKTAQGTFKDADEEDQEILKRFSFICLLSFDVYVKKMMIEHLIDGMNPPAEQDSKKKK